MFALMVPVFITRLHAMNDLTVLVLAVVLLFVNKTYDIVEEKNLTALLLAVILIKVNKTYDIVGEKKLIIAAVVIYAMDPLPPYPKKIAWVSGILLYYHNWDLDWVHNLRQASIDKAEEWKQRGNEEFKKKNYLKAYDMYTEAIDACPCPVNVEEILRQRDEFDEMEREKARSRMEEETKQRRKNDNDDGKEENSKETNPSSKKMQQQGPAIFELSHQEYGDKLAIFLNNRAATNILLERFEDAIKDADVALILNPKYARAYIRRSSAFEKTERTEEALRDVKKALELEPSNANIRKSAIRLQKIEDERLEKLKVSDDEINKKP